MALSRKNNFAPKYKRTHQKGAPATIQYYQKKLFDALYSPRQTLKSLLHRDAEGRVSRIMRVDGQVNMMDVLYTMLDDMDLRTMTWGEPYVGSDGTRGFYTKGIDWLSEKLNISVQTVKRHLNRALKEGYLSIQARRGYDKNGKSIPYFSLRAFTEKFFHELDGAEQLHRVRKYMEKKDALLNKEKLKKVLSKAAATARETVNTFAAGVNKMTRKLTQPKSDIYKTKSDLDRAYEIARSTGRSPMDVLRELQGR